MSFRVAVIPEDPTSDRYVLQPLVRALLDDCGKPRASIEVVSNPKAEGYEHAKRLLREGMIERYAKRDLLLFLPDSDLRDRSADFSKLESRASALGARLLCCAALPEVEIWLLAGHVERTGRTWSELRGHAHLKEAVFEPFLAEHGDERRAGGGRDLLMAETLRNYAGLLARCDELRVLRDRIRATIEAR